MQPWVSCRVITSGVGTPHHECEVLRWISLRPELPVFFCLLTCPLDTVRTMRHWLYARDSSSHISERYFLPSKIFSAHYELSRGSVQYRHRSRFVDMHMLCVPTLSKMGKRGQRFEDCDHFNGLGITFHFQVLLSYALQVRCNLCTKSSPVSISFVDIENGEMRAFPFPKNLCIFNHFIVCV